MPELSLLAEILGTKPLQGSLNLVSCLLETLSKLIQSASASQVDVNYVEQMLMSAIENAASNIPVRFKARVVLFAAERIDRRVPI